MDGEQEHDAEDMEQYLREMQQVPPLSAEQERLLIQQMEQGKAAREQLIETNRRLVVGIAQQYKEQILRSADAQLASERHAIEVDLTGDPWAETLITAGFDPHQPSAWLLEGFLHYLPNENITRILDEITRLAAPGSWIGFDIINSAMLTSQWTRQWVETLAASGVPWIGTMDDPEAFLATRGWKATLTLAGEEEANYGRWRYPVIPRTIPDMPRSWFVTAQKQVPNS